MPERSGPPPSPGRRPTTEQDSSPCGKLSLAAALLLALHAGCPADAGEFVVQPVTVPDLKAVFGQVQSRDTVPARARIGGTLLSRAVEEGSAVKAGDVIAVVGDEKLALQLQATDARIKALQAQLDNAAVRPGARRSR